MVFCGQLRLFASQTQSALRAGYNTAVSSTSFRAEKLVAIVHSLHVKVAETCQPLGNRSVLAQHLDRLSHRRQTVQLQAIH